MNYTKVEVGGIVRAILSAAGALFFGLNFFGRTIDENLWQELTGIALAVGSMVWSFFDKTITLEGLQGTARQFLVFAGGIAVAKGILTAEKLLSIIGIAAAIIPVIYGFLSRKKSNDLDNGTIQIHQLKK